MVCEKSVIAMLTCDKILMTEKYFDTSSDFILTESTTKVKQKIKDSTRKMKKVDSKVSGKIDKSYFSLISNIKKAIAGDDPEVLIGNKGKKLSSYIKKFIGIGAGFLIAPALSGISLITALIMSKKVKDSEKQKLLHELKDELRICEEKIKDAENEGDKKKKYRLMRIENKLNKDIEKIRYGKYIDKDRK